MGCNCKHNQEAIKEGYANFAALRELFIKRMTVDSEHSDRRKKDYNQAIFYYKSKEDVDEENEYLERYGLPKLDYDQTYPAWNEISMNMVLRCFDDAIKDWRKSFCDVEGCNRK